MTPALNRAPAHILSSLTRQEQCHSRESVSIIPMNIIFQLELCRTRVRIRVVRVVRARGVQQQQYVLIVLHEVPLHFMASSPLILHIIRVVPSDRRGARGRAGTQHCYYACRGANGPQKVVGASAPVYRQPGDGEFKGKNSQRKIHVVPVRARKKIRTKLLCFDACIFIPSGRHADTAQGSTYYSCTGWCTW